MCIRFAKLLELRAHLKSVSRVGKEIVYFKAEEVKEIREWFKNHEK